MAAITHTEAAVLSDQTRSSTTYATIPGASISSSFFTVGNKYLILATAQVSINVINDSIKVQAIHGSTAFAQSEFHFLGQVATNRFPYQWFTVWTAVSSEGIELQFACRDTGTNTVSADQVSVIAIDLSTNLTENTDWFFNETDSDATHDSTDKDGAAVTFTPSGASDWWVLSHYQGTLTTNNGTVVTCSQIRSGEASSSEPTVGYGATAAYAGAAPHQVMLSRVYSLTAASNTFTERSNGPASGGFVRRYSTMFALNLNKFKDHAFAYTSAGTNLNTTNYNVTVQTVNLTPTVQSDVLIIGFYNYDCNARDNKGEFRIQLDGADQPTGQTTDNYQIDAGNPNVGELPYILSTLASSVSAASHTINMDASVSATTSTPDAQNRSLIAFTMELAANTTVGNLAWITA